MPRGGKRPGAGRPSTAPVRVSYRFDADTVAALDRLAKAWACTSSDAVRRAVKQADEWRETK
jgi:predicted transcriptional regulator